MIYYGRPIKLSRKEKKAKKKNRVFITFEHLDDLYCVLNRIYEPINRYLYEKPYLALEAMIPGVHYEINPETNLPNDKNLLSLTWEDLKNALIFEDTIPLSSGIFPYFNEEYQQVWNFIIE